MVSNGDFPEHTFGERTSSLLRERGRGFLLSALREARARCGAIPAEVIRSYAAALGLPESEIHEVASYYPALQDAPRSEARLERELGAHVDLNAVMKASIGYPGQTRRVLARCGVIDAGSLEAFVASGGYEGLRKARALRPEEIRLELEQSRLRGAGGAAFPVARKWGFAAATPADRKIVICNAAEGDIGAFVDRGILEGDPHSVLEGLAIAGRAIGATRGIVAVRAEYETAVRVMEKALEQARAAGVFGTPGAGDAAFEIEIFQLAGTYVCGEETALLNALEGRAGHPRFKPPFPAQAGLWGMPTVVNNVKTLAHVAWILRNGADAFASVGTDSSKGTAVLSISGAVARPALVEVTMGTPLRQVLFECAGGMAPGKKLKAIQTGGPLGGLLPESALDTPISFEHLQAQGSPLGSGGILVFAADADLLAVARRFATFAREESCGHCAPCRLGTERVEALLENWDRGRAAAQLEPALAAVAGAMKHASFCAFGQAAASVPLSAIRLFPEEFGLGGRARG